MSATDLLNELTAAGLTVVEEPKWKTRGFNWAVGGKPEGVMQHHTAPPNPYPIKRLYGPPLFLIKANAATHEDGTLFLIAYKRCNFSSGRGSKKVLTENVRKQIAPTHNALVRGLQGGNKHFWNIENSHPGDGSSIPQVQLDTIVIATRVFNNHFGLVSEQDISHAEWTKRKIDPYWNGSNRTAIEQIRAGVEQGEDDMPISEEEWQRFSDLIDERIRFQLMMDDSAGNPRYIKDEPSRFFSQLVLNSALHAYSQGRKIYQTIDQARNFAKDAADHPTLGPE